MTSDNMWVKVEENYDRDLRRRVFIIPPKAVEVSTKLGVYGSAEYISRAEHNNDLRLGVIKSTKDGQKCCIISQGKECFINISFSTQVLVLPSYSWRFARDGKIPVGAVPRGYSYEGEPLYIARAITDYGDSIGQVNPRNGNCYFPRENVTTATYECLVADDNVENMQIPPAKCNIEAELLNVIESKFSKLDIKHEETANVVNEMRTFFAKIYEMYENISKRLDSLEGRCEEVGTMLKEKTLPQTINPDQEGKQNTKDVSEVTVKIKVDNIGKSCVEAFTLTKTEEQLEDEERPE